MSVSRRLRFEVLRRDNHACRYCGQMAPDVKLAVDHVNPVALGGKDEPTNLVTACVGCNAGKSSIAPDSPIVDDVAQDALRWARAIDLAVQVRALERGEVSEFIDAWEGWGFSGPGGERLVFPTPPDWRTSVEAWIRRGLPIEDIIDLIPTAMVNRTKPLRTIAPEDRWRYFCGVVWKVITGIEDDARRIIDQNLDVV